MTRVRLLQLNVCRKPVPRWSKRRPVMARVLRRARPDVITINEGTTRMVRDIITDLGGATRWGYAQHGKVWILYRKALLTRVSKHAEDLHSPRPMRRRLLSVVLRGRDGHTVDIKATHLTVHLPRSAAWRRAQARGILKRTSNPARTVVAGDINESARGGGVRAILKAGGLRQLRDRVTVGHGQRRTHVGFPIRGRVTAAASATDGRWLDEIFTGAAIRVPFSRVVNTHGATDHRGLLAVIDF